MKKPKKKRASRRLEVQLTVFRSNDKFYAVRSVPSNMKVEPENIVFKMRAKLSSMNTKQFEKRALAKARQNGLPFVHNLDKP